MKDEKIKIIQINAFIEIDYNQVILGLGEDSKIYSWNYSDGKWYSYIM